VFGLQTARRGIVRVALLEFVLIVRHVVLMSLVMTTLILFAASVVLFELTSPRVFGRVERRRRRTARRRERQASHFDLLLFDLWWLFAFRQVELLLLLLLLLVLAVFRLIQRFDNRTMSFRSRSMTQLQIVALCRGQFINSIAYFIEFHVLKQNQIKINEANGKKNVKKFGTNWLLGFSGSKR